MRPAAGGRAGVVGLRHACRRHLLAGCLVCGAAAAGCAVVLLAAACGGGNDGPAAAELSGTAASAGAAASAAPLPYAIVDSGQTACYDADREIDPPAPGDPFYGQDAQTLRNPPSYTVSADGLTVRDDVTGLTWQQSPDTNGDGVIDIRDKMTFDESLAYTDKLNAEEFGGYDDWRLPTIKELYSLILFTGTDPDPMAPSAEGQVPFLDTGAFAFAYGDLAAGERIIDSQYVSATKYVSTTMDGSPTAFGVNFADGRIKGYGLAMPDGSTKQFVVSCVRGNPAYGRNDFADNGDGTVTDRATGLMWARADSGEGMDWREALAWAQRMNAEKYLGHDDWRVPGVKELQSIIDYSRSPDTTGSAAIDPVFTCTAITNEAGQSDYPCYWTSTTHTGGGWAGMADYMAFGRAMGYMVPGKMPGGPGEMPGAGVAGGPAGSPGAAPGPGGIGPGGPPATVGPVPGAKWMDVHGAGAQRSDPKAGDPADYAWGAGPQGDAIRILNHVRLVRDAAPAGN